jgi:subtilisin family serine protease
VIGGWIFGWSKRLSLAQMAIVLSVPRRRLVPCAILAALVLAPTALADGGETAGLGEARPTAEPAFSADRVIVEWAPGAARAERVDAREAAGVSSVLLLADPDFQLVRVDPAQGIADALESLRDDPDVEVAARDGYSTPNSIPDDPLFGDLWGLRNTGTGVDGFGGAIPGADVNAPLAWDRERGSSSVVIADIDSGYRFDSPDLGPVAWENAGDPAGGGDNDGNGLVDDTHGYDFVGASAGSPSSDNDPTDDNLISGGHGVHTAGTMGAAGDDGVGITGVAQDVRIMPLRVCANSVSENNEARCPFSSQISAINYAANEGAKVANMSLGGTSSNSAVRDAIASHPGTLYVISAGNDGEDNDFEPHYPCNYNPLAEGKSAVDNVVCVAATDQADRLAGFSDWGANSVDLGAPGTETLSAYPVISELFSETFETNDFSSKWEPVGAGGFGRAAAGDGPLASFGMNDSPDGPPASNSAHVATLTNGVTVPVGSGSCTFSGLRFRRADSGSSFFYQVLSDGFPVFENTGSTNTSGSAMAAFSTVPITGLGGHSVKVRFGYTAGSSPTAESGIWLDDLELTCYAPLSTPPGYEFLQGTSMAAPHVTGAAGLLFSLKPLATVKEVRDALLAGVDAAPSLTGKTVTGGRLNIAKAMESLEGSVVDHVAPSKPTLSGTVPDSGADDNHPRIVGSAEAGSTVTLFQSLGCGGSPVAVGTAAQLAGAGIEVTVQDNSITFFSASATDAARNKSACSAATSYLEDTPPVIIKDPEVIVDPLGQSPPTGSAPPAVIQPPALPPCTVPKLAGKTLGQATAALKAAHCGLGKVTKPKARKGRGATPLVVKSSSPGAGAKQPAGGKVDLTLGPKPKPKKRHH